MIAWGTIGCLLEWASLHSRESGSLFVMIRGFWQQLQRDSDSQVTLVLGSTSVALGKDSPQQDSPFRVNVPSSYLCRRDPVILGLFGKFLDIAGTHTEYEPGY